MAPWPAFFASALFAASAAAFWVAACGKPCRPEAEVTEGWLSIPVWDNKDNPFGPLSIESVPPLS